MLAIRPDEHAQTSVSNMATATPLGPPGPDGGEAARRVAQAGRATKARLAPLAVTHRYNRTHCLWLEQFQIAEYLLLQRHRLPLREDYRSSKYVRLS
jgi:hypothetical protein